MAVIVAVIVGIIMVVIVGAIVGIIMVVIVADISIVMSVLWRLSLLLLLILSTTVVIVGAIVVDNIIGKGDIFLLFSRSPGIRLDFWMERSDIISFFGRYY